jgi:hypothetical protein
MSRRRRVHSGHSLQEVILRADTLSISPPVARRTSLPDRSHSIGAMPGGPSILPLSPPLRRGEDLSCSVGKSMPGNERGPWRASLID